MTISETIRQALRHARQAKRPRVHQRHVAASMGVSTQTIRNWEAGRASPTWEQLDRWAEFVGVEL
jgi:transcriptional regulator with XRE-family HTH domain